MSSWQLTRIILYSHDNRFTQVKFYTSSVNIIVGDSNTGKSALIEIVNYCMGSRECLIPDYVQKHCRWVAIELKRDEEYCFVARKLPPIGNQQGVQAYDVRTSTASKFPKNSMDLQEQGKSALHRVEELLGIGQFSLFDDPETQRDPFSISLRHTVPYILMSDDVIINKSKLFWDGHGPGAGHRIRQTIDTLPYFLGILNEEKLRKRSELQNLKRELRRLKKEVKETERIVSEGSRRVEQFLQKARELGMAAAETRNIQENKKIEILKSIAKWQPISKGFQPTGELPDLRLQEQELRTQLNNLEKKKKSVLRTINDANRYQEIVSAQSNRLDAINLMEDEEGHNNCPLCSRPLNGRIDSIEKMREALEVLNKDVGEVKRDRPRLDGYLRQISEESNQVRQQYQKVKARIMALVSQDEELEKLQNLFDMRQHLAGMVDMYLQSKQDVAIIDQDEAINRLEDKISVLESELDEETLADSIQAIAQRIAYEAKGILEQLPFEARYKRCMVTFDYKKLQCHLLEGTRTIPMPIIGSDENYLSLHISIFLALHRVFSENKRPVPGFILMDQISRPYFPTEQYQAVIKFEDENFFKEKTLMDERAKVRKIFNLLFGEVKKSKDLQIIVCEKAYFPDDSRFKSGLRAFWNKPDGLIPEDWPSG